ncbi:UNVERIFIED_CONTAM: hypothetical protein K2H54_062899 [Gekko kuhli]
MDNVEGNWPVRLLLQRDYGFLKDINIWSPLVTIGVYCSTLSAAMSNLIGASRILYALAKDDLFEEPSRVFPLNGSLWEPHKYLCLPSRSLGLGVLINSKVLAPAKRTSSGGNPWVAVVLSWLLVQVVLFSGKLNTIAAVVTIFFLLVYATVDLACLALEWASAPNFSMVWSRLKPATASTYWLAAITTTCPQPPLKELASYLVPQKTFLLLKRSTADKPACSVRQDWPQNCLVTR